MIKINVVYIIPHRLYVCDVVVPCVRVHCGLYHMGCVCVCAVVVPYVRVHCGLYHMGYVCLLWCNCPMHESPLRTVPHGLCLSVTYLFHAWESAADCTTWSVFICDILVPCVRVRCRLWHMGCVCVCDVVVPYVRVHCRLYHMGLLFYSLVFSLVWESIADCIHMWSALSLCERVVRCACF